MKSVYFLLLPPASSPYPVPREIIHICLDRRISPGLRDMSFLLVAFRVNDLIFLILRSDARATTTSQSLGGPIRPM